MLFVAFQVIFGENPGLSIIFISLFINSALIPVFAVAERWQKEERELRERMKPKTADIKAVFKGDERQMILTTYQKQMGYTPLIAFKSSVALLIQIPFFLAAYEFLTHTASLKGNGFLLIGDLALPDGLVGIGGISINILPFLMTLVNILASLVYTKGYKAKERIPLFTMAAVFMVLLYQSPAGLVLYWTVNNLFSLVKNLAIRLLKRPALALQWASTVAALLVIVAMLTGIGSMKNIYRQVVFATALLVLAAPYIWKYLLGKIEIRTQTAGMDRLLYFASWALLCVLSGIMIPTQVVASSPTEFEALGSFLFRTFLQGFSACIILPSLVWAFSGKRLQQLLAPSAAFLALFALMNYFLFSGSLGTLTRGFIFDNPRLIQTSQPLWTNAAAFVVALVIVLVFTLARKKLILGNVLSAVCIALFATALFSYHSIYQDMKKEAAIPDSQRSAEALFRFSRNGENNFILFLDRATSVAFYHAMELLPESIAEMEGFTFYPRTISFGECTILGVPPMLGGYEYAPWNMNKREDTLLKDKINESLCLLPRLFSEAGWRVSITDPSLANMRWIPDTSIFNKIPGVQARNIKGLYTKRFLEEHGYPEEKVTESFDYDILYRYTLFRLAPPALRYSIYYNGSWWRDVRNNGFARSLAVFPNLYYLSDLCTVDDGASSLNIFMNETTHEYGAFTPDLMPSTVPVRYSDADRARFGSDTAAAYSYCYLAAMKAIGTWLAELKRQGVYDNTRIVIVADHGGSLPNKLFDEDGQERFNPLLLVKERNARFPLRISDAFMTLADTPSFLAKDLSHPVNPYTGQPISDAEKAGPLYIYEAPGSQNRHGPYLYTLNSRRLVPPDRNIYSASSWKEVE